MFSKGNKSATSAGGTAPRQPTVPSILSADLRLTGDVAADGDVQIDGSVEGDVKCQTLTVGESGSVTGEIHAETVRIHGKVTGQIFGRSVFLSKSARMVGDVTHESLAIEPGAYMEGHCRHMDERGASNGSRRDSALLLSSEDPEPAKADAPAV